MRSKSNVLLAYAFNFLIVFFIHECNKYEIDKRKDTNRIRFSGFPNYIHFTTGYSSSMGERVGISGLWSSSGLFLGALLLLVDDGVPLGMDLGGFGAGLKLLSLLFLGLLQSVHLLFTCYCLIKISTRSAVNFHAYFIRLLSPLLWYLSVQNLSGPGP